MCVVSPTHVERAMAIALRINPAEARKKKRGFRTF